MSKDHQYNTSRSRGRLADELRDVRIVRGYTRAAHGSALIHFGDTQVLCNVSLQSGVPRFLRGQGRGWLTAEYGMLPCATATRSTREAKDGKQSGRSLEIQRFIGRALRPVVDFEQLGEFTLILDCDVLQADGGTRTAAITGGCVALADALRKHTATRETKAEQSPLLCGLVAAVSVGIYQNTVVLDMDYAEDLHAATDMNVVMNSAGEYIEVQGCAEGQAFNREQLDTMLERARHGIQTLLDKQKAALYSEC